MVAITVIVKFGPISARTFGKLRRNRHVIWGTVKNPLPHRLSDDSRLPCGIGIDAKTTKCGSADQMALDVEGVVDCRAKGACSWSVDL